MKKEEIVDLLYNKLDYLYCDTCKFSSITEEEAEEKYSYYACDDCHRKKIKWEISKGFCEQLADEIVNGSKNA